MRTFVGIDLGSTTTKAVLLDDNKEVIGRGITNSRSNYATAARVATEEARIDARFTLFRRALHTNESGHEHSRDFLAALERSRGFDEQNLMPVLAGDIFEADHG